MTTHTLNPPAIRHSWPALIGWVALAHASGLLGSAAIVDARTFYGELVQPSWAPPGGVVAPVWLVLYTLMGIAAWLVWGERQRTGTRGALTVFVLQLAVNVAWSWAFFGGHAGAVAVILNVVLAGLILVNTMMFWRIHRLAGALLLPYLAWACFAGVLTYVL